MFNANAVARTDGCVTFASAVFDGPVLKNRKNSAMNSSAQAAGNGTYNIPMSEKDTKARQHSQSRKPENTIPQSAARNLSPAMPSQQRRRQTRHHRNPAKHALAWNYQKSIPRTLGRQIVWHPK